MTFRIEKMTLADGKVHDVAIVTCGKCGNDVFINSITKDPRDYKYYCIVCGTFVPESVMKEVIKKLGFG